MKILLKKQKEQKDVGKVTWGQPKLSLIRAKKRYQRTFGGTAFELRPKISWGQFRRIQFRHRKLLCVEAKNRT